MFKSDELMDTKIIRVRGCSIAECAEKARIKFGDSYDYFKTNVQEIRYGGFLGIGAIDGVEVTMSLLPKKVPIERFILPPDDSSPPRNFFNNDEDFHKKKQAVLNAAADATKKDKPETKEDNSAVEKETVAKVAVDKESVEKFYEEVQKINDKLETIKNSASDEHPTILKIEEMLENNEFSASYIRKIIDRIKKEFSMNEIEDFKLIESSVVRWIGESIKITKNKVMARPQVLILIGPTGVGKTTTVAKIAASIILDEKKQARGKVAIITIDGFRIAARQQIESLGLAMEVPVFYCDENYAVTKKLEEIKDDYDYILFDTTGYSPKDFDHIEMMRKLLKIDKISAQTYLALSASTKVSDMKDSLNQFEVFDYDSVIVTKIDETSKVGNVISALSEKQKSVAYLTTGQNIPRDIEDATVLTFLNRLADFKIDKAVLSNLF